MSRSRDVKMGENARTRSFFSPRARVLLYFYCFDGSDAREYVCLFFAKWVGKKKRKKARLWWKTRNKNSSKFVLARGGRKKTKTQPKSKFYSLLLVFFLSESHTTKTSFFSSLSSWFCARAGTFSQIFCRITQTHPKLLIIAPGTCTRALWQNIILTNPR